MAITEVDAHLKYVNSSGDTTVIYPITKADNVEGLNAAINSIKEEHVSAYGIVTKGANGTYTATVKGIDSLAVGASFIMVPHETNATTTPSLNVNGLGIRFILRRISTNSRMGVSNTDKPFIVADMPIRVTYDGEYWIADDVVKPDATDLYGVVPVTSGGTGGTTAEAARANLGAAPTCTYGTTDIVAGSQSTAPNGTVHFVYVTVGDVWDHVKSIFIAVDGVWRLVWDMTSSGDSGDSAYGISEILTGVTGVSSNATKISDGDVVDLVYTADTGYDLPETISVDGASYMWYESYGRVVLLNPTKNVTVSITGVPTSYSITTNLTGVTGRTLNPTTITKNDTAALLFYESSGYILPSTISVEGASYTWDDASGSLMLFNPTGNVIVTIKGIEAEPVVYSITTNLTGVTGDSSNPTTITENKFVSLKFYEKTGYESPDSVSVTGAKYNWSNYGDQGYGYLVLSNPTKNVTVTITGVLKTYSITTNLTGVTGDSSNPKVMAKDSSATLSFTASTGYYLPATVTVTGATYTWTRSTTTTGTLKLSNPTDDITIKIVGDGALVDL